eukprot:TRINITY_DN7280_c0_g1_i1.p1 TRINITY_DN7280_c0_g1~~TRINITY_DN7280_c0_g1_i1.p1  ORF type:complete len:188 (-),score=43.77 TRINITY_DN7280_c0_g1_i1:154-717(-)
MADEFELDDMSRLPPRPAQAQRPRSQMFEEPLHIGEDSGSGAMGGGMDDNYGADMGGFGGDPYGGGGMFGGPGDMGPMAPLAPMGGGMMGQPMGGGMMGASSFNQTRNEEAEFKRRRNRQFNRVCFDCFLCLVILGLLLLLILGGIILYQLFELGFDLHDTTYKLEVPSELPDNFPNYNELAFRPAK